MSPTTDRLAQTNANIKAHPLVQQTGQVVNGQLNALDRELSKYPFLNDWEAKSKIPKTYGVIGLSVTFLFLIFLNVFGLASPVTNLIGWALPAYLSCHALESPQTGDDKQWLTYWIVFGYFNFIESAALRLVLYYIPYYFTIKLAFTIWLMLPATRGAEKLYHSALRPSFLSIQRLSKSAQRSTPSTKKPTSPTTSSTNTSTSIPPTTASSGYSTATDTQSNNPFVGSATSVGTDEGKIPPAAGVPLP